MKVRLSDHGKISKVLCCLLYNNLRLLNWLYLTMGDAGTMFWTERFRWLALWYILIMIFVWQNWGVRVFHKFYCKFILFRNFIFWEDLWNNVQNKINACVYYSNKSEDVTSSLPFQSVHHQTAANWCDNVSESPGAIIHGTALVWNLFLIFNFFLFLDCINNFCEKWHKGKGVRHSYHKHRNKWQVPIVKRNAWENWWRAQYKKGDCHNYQWNQCQIPCLQISLLLDVPNNRRS